MIYNESERIKELQSEVSALRQAARQIAKVKKVVAEFDGKVYNCRLDNAIGALSDDNYRLVMYAAYGSYIYIDCRVQSENKSVTLMYLRKPQTGTETDYFTDKKRVKAAEIIESLNNKYSELMKEAAEIERTIESIDVSIQQIKQLKSMINGIINAMPTKVVDVYGLKRIYY